VAFQRSATVAGLVAILGNGTTASASPETVHKPQMVVAVLNDAAASRDVLAAAQARLIGVFEAIGVSVVWVDMYAGDRSVFVVRIVNEEGAESLQVAPGSIGVALGAEDRHGWLGYVFYERIAHLAERNGVAVSAVLGAAIAHELGHLLLPHGCHSPRGLMRPDWNRADLLTADGRGLRFTVEQGALIRAALGEPSREGGASK